MSPEPPPPPALPPPSAVPPPSAPKTREELDALNATLRAEDPENHYPVQRGPRVGDLDVILGKFRFYRPRSAQHGNEGGPLTRTQILRVMTDERNKYGFTYAARQDEHGNPTRYAREEGYAVAIQGTVLPISEHDLFNSDGAPKATGFLILSRWLRRHAKIFEEPNAFLGGWHDLGDEVYEINWSVVLDGLRFALQAAARNDQISTFGFAERDTFEAGGRNEIVK